MSDILYSDSFGSEERTPFAYISCVALGTGTPAMAGRPLGFFQSPPKHDVLDLLHHQESWKVVLKEGAWRLWAGARSLTVCARACPVL